MIKVHEDCEGYMNLINYPKFTVWVCSKCGGQESE